MPVNPQGDHVGVALDVTDQLVNDVKGSVTTTVSRMGIPLYPFAARLNHGALKAAMAAKVAAGQGEVDMSADELVRCCDPPATPCPYPDDYQLTQIAPCAAQQQAGLCKLLSYASIISPHLVDYDARKAELIALGYIELTQLAGFVLPCPLHPVPTP
jgi:hypothetical protein